MTPRDYQRIAEMRKQMQDRERRAEILLVAILCMTTIGIFVVIFAHLGVIR